MKGYIKLTAAKGVFPTKLDTKYPSTTPYTDVKIIIIIDGRVKRKSFLYVKCSDNLIKTVSSFREVSVHYSITEWEYQGKRETMNDKRETDGNLFSRLYAKKATEVHSS